MKQNRIGFIVAGLLLGLGFNYFFVTEEPGLSITLWFMLALGLAIALAKLNMKPIAPVSWILVGLTFVFALFPAIRAETFTRILGIMLAFAGLLLLAGTLLHGGWPKFQLLDYLINGLVTIAASIANPFAVLIKGKGTEAGTTQSGRRILAGVLRGILITIPILIVLSMLLASADMVFAERLEGLAEWFQPERFNELIFRIALILIVAYLTIGALLHAVREDGSVLNKEQNAVGFKPFLGWIETVIILGGMTLLFGFFVVIQFQYLFGGQNNIHEAGFTYSEYAVKGFTELILVALLTLLVILTMGRISKRSNISREFIFRGLAGLNLGFVLVMVASAWMRLQLYLQAYAYTRLRTYTMLFIPWVAVLILGTLVMHVLGKGRKTALLAFICLIGFGLTIGVANVDKLVAEKNIERAVVTPKIDHNYLLQLSGDAIYPLWEGTSNPGLSTDDKDKLLAVLACKKGEYESNPLEWRQTNWGKLSAREKLSMDMPGQYIPLSGTAQVLLNGKTFDCNSSTQFD